MQPGYGRGITNRQASYLAALCRELGWPYAGHGMTRAEASDAIVAAKQAVELRRAQLAQARLERARRPSEQAAS